MGIDDNVFIEFSKTLVSKLIEVIKGIDVKDLELYKIGCKEGKNEVLNKILELTQCVEGCSMPAEECEDCMYSKLEEIEKYCNEQLKGNNG